MSLSNGSRTDRVLSRRMTFLNHTTGEVLEKNEEVRLKAKTREEFFLVFVNNRSEERRVGKECAA